ncbi:hypothetical protein C1H46_038654 [Malus baccata]|uniref:non-specific serine/threonine protein kinase n=1 Tax=Malus baccata TaxID=106549 RepID=A0A540KNL1_MALBA|nr:hypothetical protein C1H46_038654 [Malus baccata]
MVKKKKLKKWQWGESPSRRNISVGRLSSPCRGEQVLHMYDMKMKLMMRILLLCFLSCFWFQLSFVQNATTDPSEVRALNSIFEQWDTQAAPGLWNISGEPCNGSAINGTKFEFSDNNPAIYCNCTYDNNATCHITDLHVDNNYFTGPLPAFIGNMSALTELNLVVNNFTFDSSNITLPGLNCLQRNFPCNRNAPQCNLLLCHPSFTILTQRHVRGKGIASLVMYTLDIDCKHVFISSVIRITDANFSINCGGPQVMGRDGKLYEAENSALGPATFSVTSTEKWAVSNAGLFSADRNTPLFRVNTHAQVTGIYVSPELFQTSRMSPGSLRYYGLGLENGPYTVTLHFAETVFESRTSQTWQSLGRRVFDIYIQGALKMKDFDISKEAGGVNREYVSKFYATLSENYLEIHLFWAGKGTCCIPDQGDYGPLIAVVHAASDLTPIVDGHPPTTPPTTPPLVDGHPPTTPPIVDMHPPTPPTPPPTTPPTTPGKKINTRLIVGIAVPVGVVSLLLIFVILYMRRKKSEKEDDEDILGLGPRPYTFSYVELRTATEDFNPSNKLGMDAASKAATAFWFMSILKTRALIRHFLVQTYLLLGTSNLHLDWPTRFNILLGTARGLAYLHEESRPRIVHRDVKASNILLDAKLSPKISDFGLAKLYDDEKTHISTRVAGTIGYLAPEYALFGHLTEKADVFGFGVVVLEILSGRPNSYNNLDPEKIYLLEWVWTLHENDQTLGLVDPRLTEFNETEATRLIRAALLCTQGSPMARPSMSRVVAMLSGDIDIGTVMSKPSYLTDYNFKDITTFSTGRFLVEDDTPSTASKHSNVHLNYQPEGSNASGANTAGVDPTPSPVNVTQSLLTGIIGEGR